MNKAISSLIIKSVDAEKREIVGVATNGRSDRIADVLDPMGATFAKSVPLLVGHSHDLIVGRVAFHAPTKAGVGFTAKMPKIEEPGPLRDRVDTAWGEVRAGLITDVSVGFQPEEGQVERLSSGGRLFKKFEIYELSLCAVGMNPDAKILEVRAARAARRAASTKPAEKRAVVFISAAERRKHRGGLIVDEKRFVRNARRALALMFGESAVPAFQTLKALENWDDDRQRAALARGTTWIGYENVVASAPKPKHAPIVRLNDPVFIRSIR